MTHKTAKNNFMNSEAVDIIKIAYCISAYKTEFSE